MKTWGSSSRNAAFGAARLTAFAAVAALALTACGGGDDDEPAAGPDAPGASSSAPPAKPDDAGAPATAPVESAPASSDVPTSVIAAGELPDAVTLIDQSATDLRVQKSVHVELSTTGELIGVPVRELSGDVTSTPAGAATGNANVRINEQFYKTDFIVIGGQLYAKLDGANFSEVGAAQESYDPAVLLDPERGVANLVAKIQNPVSEARETVDGADTVKITGTLSPSEFDSIVPGLGGRTEAFPITVWVTAAAPFVLVKAEVTIDDAVITIDTSKWGEPVTITAP